MKAKEPMDGPTVRLEYFNGKRWVPAGAFTTEWVAWQSLGGDDLNYRTTTTSGEVLTDKRVKVG